MPRRTLVLTGDKAQIDDVGHQLRIKRVDREKAFPTLQLLSLLVNDFLARAADSILNNFERSDQADDRRKEQVFITLTPLECLMSRQYPNPSTIYASKQQSPYFLLREAITPLCSNVRDEER